MGSPKVPTRPKRRYGCAPEIRAPLGALWALALKLGCGFAEGSGDAVLISVRLPIAHVLKQGSCLSEVNVVAHSIERAANEAGIHGGTA